MKVATKFSLVVRKDVGQEGKESLASWLGSRGKAMELLIVQLEKVEEERAEVLPERCQEATLLSGEEYQKGKDR
jgi:hypothetical protein